MILVTKRCIIDHNIIIRYRLVILDDNRFSLLCFLGHIFPEYLNPCLGFSATKIKFCTCFLTNFNYNNNILTFKHLVEGKMNGMTVQFIPQVLFINCIRHGVEI